MECSRQHNVEATGVFLYTGNEAVVHKNNDTDTTMVNPGDERR